jgi:hypothetical protein
LPSLGSRLLRASTADRTTPHVGRRLTRCDLCRGCPRSDSRTTIRVGTLRPHNEGSNVFGCRIKRSGRGLWSHCQSCWTTEKFQQGPNISVESTGRKSGMPPSMLVAAAEDADLINVLRRLAGERFLRPSGRTHHEQSMGSCTNASSGDGRSIDRSRTVQQQL